LNSTYRADTAAKRRGLLCKCGEVDRVLLAAEKIGLSRHKSDREEEMSEHYHDVGDLRFFKEMGQFAPTEFNACLRLDKIVGREDATIPRKYRVLIALGEMVFWGSYLPKTGSRKACVPVRRSFSRSAIRGSLARQDKCISVSPLRNFRYPHSSPTPRTVQGSSSSLPGILESKM